MKPFLVAVLIFITSVSLAAQTPSVGERIVVTASSIPESLESTPAAVSVITREDIDKQQARDVADVLREVPGLAIARTGSPGKFTSLFIRGGSSKQALVLWNGVQMNNPYLSGYNFGQLSTAGVEKIEIIRGPYSALYGSEAVSGVVNVLTTPTQSELRVDVAGGGNGLRNGLVSGALVKGIWTMHGAIEHRDDDGFAPNDDFTADTVVAGVQATPQPNLSLALVARNNRYDLGIPRNVNRTFTAFVPTLHRREKGSESQIALPIRFRAADIQYDLRLSDSERSEKFGDPDAPFGAEFGNTDASSRTARLTAQSRRSVAGVITIGVEVERASVDHTDSFGLDVRHRSRDSRSFFAEDRFSKQLNSGALELAVGARYDRFDTFGSQVSPRVAIAWIAGNSKWRAAYGAGFRAPAIGELYAPFFGNPQLDAERSRNVEIGFDRYIRQATISLTAFRSEYDDLIVYDVAANRFGNIARARAHGVEGSASRRLGNFSGAVSYTWLKAIDADTEKQLARRPKNSGSLSLGYDFNPVSAELVVIHSGERPDVTDLAPFGAVINAAYTTADVTLRYNAGAFTPFVKVENATNRRYDEVFGYPSATRRLIAGIRYSLR
ncbi:MAG TPA: TonB-dependent receptor [Thermoanaerobaculia bacterium]|jgi:vitamin B12 transporter|nr:TonB-dependent receptor [Thermoanaerobaculia bacterium]